MTIDNTTLLPEGLEAAKAAAREAGEYCTQGYMTFPAEEIAEAAIRAYLAVQNARPDAGEPVAVKGLDWRTSQAKTFAKTCLDVEYVITSYLRSPFTGNYEVFSLVMTDGYGLFEYASLAAAKAAAQADYETRIRSALSPAPSLAVSDEMVEVAAKRVCLATGLDYESLEDSGPDDHLNNCSPETKGWFRYLARAAIGARHE